MICYQTKIQDWLPVAIKAKLVRQMLVKKKRGFIQVLQCLGKWQTPISKPISSARPRQKPVFQHKIQSIEAAGSC